jgi:hypothetical protein
MVRDIQGLFASGQQRGASGLHNLGRQRARVLRGLQQLGPDLMAQGAGRQSEPMGRGLEYGNIARGGMQAGDVHRSMVRCEVAAAMIHNSCIDIILKLACPVRRQLYLSGPRRRAQN